jgi:hypothetical protein
LQHTELDVTAAPFTHNEEMQKQSTLKICIKEMQQAFHEVLYTPAEIDQSCPGLGKQYSNKVQLL